MRRNGRELNFPIIVLVLVACVAQAQLLPPLPPDHLPPLPPQLPLLQLLLGAIRSSVSTTRISSTKNVQSSIATGWPRTPTVAVKRKMSILLALNLVLRLPFAWK